MTEDGGLTRLRLELSGLPFVWSTATELKLEEITKYKSCTDTFGVSNILSPKK